MKNKQDSYVDLISRLDGLEVQISRVKDQLQELRDFLNESQDFEEVCHDEVEADKAAMEAIHDICLESLFDIESKGDA